MDSGAVAFRASTIRIGWGSIVGLPRVDVYNGTIKLRGSPETLQAVIQGKPNQPTSVLQSSGNAPKLSFSGTVVDWNDGRRSCRISGLDVSTDNAFRHARFANARCTTDTYAVEIRDGRTGIDISESKRANKGEPVLQADDSENLRHPLKFEGAALHFETTFGTTQDPTKSPKQPSDHDEVNTFSRDTQQLRKILTSFDPEIQQTLDRVPIGSSLTFPIVTVRLKSGFQKLDLGTWGLHIERSSDVVSADLTQGDTQQKAASSVRFRLWTKEHRSEFTIAIGPIALQQLGISNGDFGLESVDDTHVSVTTTAKVASDSDAVSLVSQGDLSQLSFFQPWVAKQRISGLDLGWSGAIKYEPAANRFKTEELHFTLGKVSARVVGEFEMTEPKSSYRGSIEVPLAACQDFFDALPPGFAPLLENWQVDGTFGIAANVDYDAKSPDKTNVKLVLDNHCRIRSVPGDVNPNKFERPFVLEVEDDTRQPQSMSFGPGTWNWTPLSAISPYVESAVLVCEDGRFLRHGGFDVEAIQNSIRDNLRSGRFVRGGSTVSMQLAKNLYLRRDKTLSRKLQEAALTLLLEQSFGKRQLLELYLNVIEYGPGVYGIGPAARHYFDTTPERLTMAQSFYLISLLPNPKVNHFDADNFVAKGRLKQLRWLMGIAAKRGHFTQAELDVGLAEQPAFRVPGSPTLAPSRRITGDLSTDDNAMALPMNDE